MARHKVKKAEKKQKLKSKLSKELSNISKTVSTKAKHTLPKITVPKITVPKIPKITVPTLRHLPIRTKEEIKKDTLGIKGLGPISTGVMPGIGGIGAGLSKATKISQAAQKYPKAAIISKLREASPEAYGKATVAAAGLAAGAATLGTLRKGDKTMSNRYIQYKLPDLGVPGPGIFNPVDITPGVHGGVVKVWEANGALFQRNQDGTITVRKKDGSLKTYKPYRPIVFGKKLDARKLIRVANRHRSLYKSLHKLFGKMKARSVKR